MTSTLVDLVKINCTSSGTGPFVLGGAVTGYRGVEALTNGKSYSYSVQQGALYEVGRGTYLSSTRTLVRSPLFSSRGGAPINFSVNAQVSFVAVAEDLDAVNISADAVAAAAAAAASASNAAASAAAAVNLTPTVDLFANIGSHTIASAVTVITTGGYSTAGKGSWRYVCDSLATSVLAAAYPLLCTQSADGRYWRAQPDVDGLVPVFAAGVIGFTTPTYTTNQQPGIQQVIDYCFATGAAGIVCERFKHYAIWTPQRTPTATVSTSIHTDKTGIPFLVNRNANGSAPSVGKLRVRGNGATFWRRSQTGGDPSTVGAWQTLADGSGWRGGMFMLCGSASMPSDYNARTGLELENIKLMGGIPFVSPGSYDPVNGFNKTTGQGWDVTDKPVWAENDLYTGDISYVGDVLVDGFGGEHHYQGGQTHGSIYQSGGTLTLSNSNGDGFNPCPSFSAEGYFTGGNGVVCGGTVRMESVRIRKCFQALEGSTGWNGRIGSLAIEDCDRGNGLMAGVWWQGTQPTGLTFPILKIDSLRVERSTFFTVLRGNRIGNATLVDSYCQIGQSNIPVYGTDILSLEIMADKGNISDGVTFYGTTGTKASYQNRIRLLRCSQSDNAVANTLRVQNPCGYYGSFGDQNMIERITGYALYTPFSRTPAGVTDFHVGFGDLHGLSFQQPATAVNIESAPALTTFDSVIVVNNTSASGLFSYTLPSSVGKLPVGARRRIIANATGTSVFALGTTNTCNAASMLQRNNEKLELEFDGYFWTPTRPANTQRLSASASLTWSAIAAGATSAEQTITLNGVKLTSIYNYRVFAVPSASTWPAGAQLNARVSADNTIAVSVTNQTGSSLTPPTGNINVFVELLG
jgi:hypothetical protein